MALDGVGNAREDGSAKVPSITATQSKKWVLVEGASDGCEAARELGESLDIHPITAQLLLNRGVRTPAEALEFLYPSLDDLHDPFLLPDAEKAVDRILRAILEQETIFVHGDYDVDGVTSAALFTRVLRKLGANVIPFVPCRSREGYGVRIATIEKAHQDGAGLVITCDCGISANDACERAVELGLDLIVTDHHQCQATLPPAYAVVNPSRKDSRYPFADLAGVGVAYKICQALCIKRNIDLQGLHKHFLDLVALGTVSDVASLTGENRAYVYHGLRSIADSKKEGLKALIAASGLLSADVDTEDIGFRLGPRINAAGRLAEASTALELFLTADADVAKRIAEEMSACNLERQSEQQRILLEALQALAEDDLYDHKVLIVGREGWHPGVIGIVAGRLAEDFYRPAIVFTVKDGAYHGSGRSIPGFNLAKAIEEIGSDLVHGGGHAMAAGISFSTDSLQVVREKFNRLADQWLTEEDLSPSIQVELEVDSDEISIDLGREIGRFAPFGEGNRQPMLMSTGVRFVDIRTMGSNGKHLRARVSGKRSPVSVIGWGMGEDAGRLNPSVDYNICYNLSVSRFNGTERVELILQDAPQEAL